MHDDSLPGLDHQPNVDQSSPRSGKPHGVHSWGIGGPWIPCNRDEESALFRLQLTNRFAHDLRNRSRTVISTRLIEGSDTTFLKRRQQIAPSLLWSLAGRFSFVGGAYQRGPKRPPQQRVKDRRVGKECRSRWSPYH